MSNKTADASARNPTQYNIEAIAKLEEEALDRRTAAERASDAIVKSIGSTPFLLLHVMLVAIWSTINLNLIPGVRAFDPFPFGILALVLAAESVFLTIFVLISQNRMAREAEPLPSRSASRHARRTGTHRDASNAAKALPACRC
jgi:uncharacterized membrane protein